MTPKKVEDISSKESSKKKDDEDDLKRFVQKKKNQNVALKKIIANLNTTTNDTINKYT